MNTSHPVLLGAIEIRNRVETFMIGEDIVEARRQLDTLRGAWHALVRLGVSQYVIGADKLFKDVRAEVDAREEVSRVEMLRAIQVLFGDDSPLEPVQGSDAAMMLLDILVDEAVGDLVLTIGDDAYGACHLRIDGDALEIVATHNPSHLPRVTRLETKDVVAIGLRRDEGDIVGGEIMTRSMKVARISQAA